MKLGIVQTIWNAISDLVSSTLTIDIIFYIGVGFLLLMSLFFFIRSRTSYEYKLDKTADRLNEWLFKNQNITDQNLVEFNNIIKDRRSPKILRKYWQQYMLYRDKAPSEYMSTYNCIDKPLKTSSFTSNIKNFTMIYIVTAVVTFFLSMLCFASRSDAILTYLTQSMVASVLILFIGLVLTLALRAMQNYNIATLYQTFNVFNRYIDKASTTIPKYVDFEILFTKQEIKDGIPILGEYLEKRARQEQEELEEAQRNAISHEEYNFSESGVDGALVLERAMKESETYINIKQRLLTEIQQFESEISTLKKNYENTSKDYQRKLQASKENMERLRQQQEESTNRIEVNYIRKQQQDEVKKQEQLEKDQEDATNKFNVEINSLNEEIEKRRTELETKKNAVQEAMQAEYQTFSSKLHKTISDEVEKSKVESIQQVTNEKNQYAQAITYLKNEVDSRDALIRSKDQTIADLATKLQEYLGEKFVAEQVNTVEQEPVAQETEDDSQGHYDEKGYYWFNNGTYYDANNLYHDLDGNVFDSEGNLLQTGVEVEKEVKKDVATTIAEVAAKEPVVEVKEQQPEPAPAVQEVTPTEEEKPLEEELFNSTDDLGLNIIQDVKPQDVKTREYADGTYYDANNLYHDTDGKVYNTEGKQIEEPKQPEEEKVEEQPESAQVSESAEPKRKAGRPKKQVEAQEETPKKKAGRPRKTAGGAPETPKRKAGRPKKEETVEQTTAKKVGRPKTSTKVEEPAKKKAGRPKKTQVEETKPTATKKVGRPKKQTTEEPATPKRKVGRPKKSDANNQNAELLKQLGESLINISSNKKCKK